MHAHAAATHSRGPDTVHTPDILKTTKNIRVIISQLKRSAHCLEQYRQMSWFGSKKPTSVGLLGQGIAKMATQTVNVNAVKSFEEHLKETLEARKSHGRSAVAETLSKYQDADKWPQFPVPLPAPMKLAVKKKAYDVDDDEDEDDDNEGGCCNCCGCCSMACKCGPRTLLYGLSCVMMMCCMQGLILRKAVGFLLKRKWSKKIEDGIDLQVLHVI